MHYVFLCGSVQIPLIICDIVIYENNSCKVNVGDNDVACILWIVSFLIRILEKENVLFLMRYSEYYVIKNW